MAKFWIAHQDPKGDNMGYQAILDTLKKKHKAVYAPDAAAARKFFAEDLGWADANGVFTYRKSIYNKDKEIALHWHKLLEDSKGIQAWWEAMQLKSKGTSGWPATWTISSLTFEHYLCI